MAGYAGLGTVLSIDHVDIAELTMISGPSVTSDVIDVSSHDAVAEADAYRTFVHGLLDGGEVSLEGNMVGGGQMATIMDPLESRDTVIVTITFPRGVAIWAFEGIVTAFETGAPHDGKLSFSASIKVTGAPTFTEGS